MPVRKRKLIQKIAAARFAQFSALSSEIKIGVNLVLQQLPREVNCRHVVFVVSLTTSQKEVEYS